MQVQCLGRQEITLLLLFITGVPFPEVRPERGQEARDLVRSLGGRCLSGLRSPHRWCPLLVGGGQLLLPSEDPLEVLLLRPRGSFRREVRIRFKG